MYGATISTHPMNSLHGAVGARENQAAGEAFASSEDENVKNGLIKAAIPDIYDSFS